MHCIFTKIIQRQIPADIVYEDDLAIAFRDINPQAPVHVLVVPREPLSGVQSAKAEQRELLGHLLLVASRVAEQEGVDRSGYRCIINAGPDGGQEVQHLHIDVLGGKPLGPMLAAR